MLIDTHAHLTSEAFDKDYKDVIQRALDANIWMIVVGSDLESSRRAVEIAEEFPKGVFASVGLHPKKIQDPYHSIKELLNIDDFRDLVRHPKVVALGETGLDYHDLPESPGEDPEVHLALKYKQLQKDAIELFVKLSAETRLPIIMHCREAQDELIEWLEAFDFASSGFDTRGVIHLYEGSLEQARRFIQLDFALSFTGLVTHAHYKTDVISQIPLQKLLIESDCPYLTPDPPGAGRNEPLFIRETMKAVALIRDKSEDEMEGVLEENARNIFKNIA